MPKVSVLCIVLAWLVALFGVITGVSLFLNGNLNGAVSTVTVALVTSMALIVGAIRKDPRCDGFYEIKAGLDMVPM